MDQNLAVAIMFVAIIVAVTRLGISIMDYRIKSRIIKSGLLDENAIKTFNKLVTNFSINSLKWGIILFFGGMGLIILEYVSYKPTSTLPYGIESVMIAFGFLSYFIINKKYQNQVHL